MIINNTDLDAILSAKHGNPHSILGLHPCRGEKQKGLVARAFILDAKSCEIIDIDSESEKRYPLKKIAPQGFFEGWLSKRHEVFRYRLRIVKENGEIHQFYDPYCYLPTVTDYDFYIFNEGNDHRIYEKLGAHMRHIDGVSGVAFAVWAPSAKRVSVVGDFNSWKGLYHPMRLLGSSGVWELFIPGLAEYTKYKYEIVGAENFLRLKTDPFGTYFESPPNNASIVKDLNNYSWQDKTWIEARAETDWLRQPISIYEIHMGSWKRDNEDGSRPLNYREMASELVNYVKDMGFTHVEFLPLNEHPFTGSWGYQVTGFFAPTFRFGTPEDFMYLVDTLHGNGIGVIMDWVPGHFPKDSFSLVEFDGTHLYEHADPRLGYHRDWDTLVFNYSRHEVWCFLVASALAWFDRYHIDGLRVDAVASMLYLDYSRNEGEWIPNKFGGKENLEAIQLIRQTNELVHHYYPGAMMIAEESTSWKGVTLNSRDEGLGFDLKWNMGWMHDTLRFFEKNSQYRERNLNDLTFASTYQHSENFIVVLSHDEVVHGKSSMIMKMGAQSMSAKSQNLRALYALMWAWPGKKTLFMGSEFGQSSEWKYDGCLDWHLMQYMDHEGIKRIVRDLNTLYRSEPGLYINDHIPDNLKWIRPDDTDNIVISFLRKGRKAEELYLVVGNYSSIARQNYRIGVPFSGQWKELINSDADAYGGSGRGNLGSLSTKPIPCDNYDYSLNLTLSHNTTLIFKLEVN